MTDEIDELLAPEENKKNWYTKLPHEIQVVLTGVRRKMIESPTVSVSLLHRRLCEKYGEVMPRNAKRLGEFLRNEGRIYPDAEAADGAERTR